MKTYFDKQRTQLLSVYGKELKRRFPGCRYSSSGSIMKVMFPRQAKYRSLNLDDFFLDQEYYSWRDRKAEQREERPSCYIYAVSIFPKDTLVYKLRWLQHGQIPAYDVQTELIYHMMILHMEYIQIPHQIHLSEIMPCKQASDVITALVHNRHVALVLDFEWHDTANQSV